MIDEAKFYVESYQEILKKNGCTLMAYGWIDQKRRNLINFLVYCPKGTNFSFKFVDVWEASKIAKLLYKLFKELVICIELEINVHMVTDNAYNYITASKLLMEEFASIFWSPSSVYCINLKL